MYLDEAEISPVKGEEALAAEVAFVADVVVVSAVDSSFLKTFYYRITLWKNDKLKIFYDDLPGIIGDGCGCCWGGICC